MTASRKSPQREDRSARLRAALRENLKRRKAQAKARGVSTDGTSRNGKTLDSARIRPDKTSE